MPDTPRTAFVHDWLVNFGGAEHLLETALNLFPNAPLFTLIHQKSNFSHSPINTREIHTSFIDRLPFARSKYRVYIPLMPLAIEQFDLRGYEVIISISHAVAHGILPQPGQLHINYIQSPARYAWHQFHSHLSSWGFEKGVKTIAARILLHYLRLWDLAAAQRVDHFIANSHWVARAVWRAYRRKSQVIYPPVRVEDFSPAASREDYYITVSRLVPYKRVDVIVGAFAKLGLPLIIIGDGPEYKRLSRMATTNIQIMRDRTDKETADLLSKAKAFVYAAEEDFGIAPVEAQAAGCPVIAYGSGGLRETIIEGKTGFFFDQQSPESLQEAVTLFESGNFKFEVREMRANSKRFNVSRWQKEFSAVIEQQWENHQRRY